MWYCISFLFLLLLLPVLSTAVAIPSVDSVTSPSIDTFSLSVSRKNVGRRDFVREWTAARQKWGGWDAGPAASMFSLAEDDGIVEVDPIGNDDLYLADVQVGNPPQTVKMALDTGSSDVWLQSTDTRYRINPHGPWAPQYHPKESTTSQLLNESRWDVQYLDGTAAYGIVYRDTIRLADLEVNNATVQSALKFAVRFETDTELSGIMGLAKKLPNNIEPGVPTFLELLKPMLKSPVFTVDLKKNATGQFEFGRIDETRASESITWIDSDPNSPHWDVEFDLTSWSAKDRAWWYYKFPATIDTGTTLMFLPDALASRYWLSVPGMRPGNRLTPAYTFPCANAEDLPDLMFKLPGTEHVITIPGRYINYGPVDDRNDYCWGGMQSSAGMDVVVLGDIMLKALFVAFDVENNRIGFANKKLDD